jgi:hypothetical protein
MYFRRCCLDDTGLRSPPRTLSHSRSSRLVGLDAASGRQLYYFYTLLFRFRVSSHAAIAGF